MANSLTLYKNGSDEILVSKTGYEVLDVLPKDLVTEFMQLVREGPVDLVASIDGCVVRYDCVCEVQIVLSIVLMYISEAYPGKNILGKGGAISGS